MPDRPEKAARKHRTAMSCDRCKARKTKCKNPVPGPCEYCASTGMACNINLEKRRQRPFYFVSQEEYSHMQKIVRHYFPSTELSLPMLRAVTSQLNGEEGSPGPPPQSSMATTVVVSEHEIERRRIEAPSQQQDEELPLDEVVQLHQDSGCMLADSAGEFRYSGPDSGASFNSAVRDMDAPNASPFKDKSIIAGMRAVSLPIPHVKETVSDRLLDTSKLPTRELCDEFVSRYFEEVHCLYWLYPSESFHSRLEATLANANSAITPSWLCSLYSIFVMGCLSSAPLDPPSHAIKPKDYLELAKALVPRVCDEANIDSIRAMILLALALQASAFLNSSYLYTGIAVRMAYSLGLHLDKYICPDPVDKEVARRLWWTLVCFDGDVALRVGRPNMTGDVEHNLWDSPLPSEKILSPGPYSLPGYLERASTLTHITKSARERLYIVPISGKKRLSKAVLNSVLASLQEWRASVPAYLDHGAPVAPFQKRPICLLHLRYWSVVILVTRPFLLCNLRRHTDPHQAPSIRYFEELGNMCIDAAEQGLAIFHEMAQNQLLSGVLVSETWHALDIVQVFLLASKLKNSEMHLDQARKCWEALKTVSTVGYCRTMFPEITNELREWGVLTDSSQSLPLSLSTTLDSERRADLYSAVLNSSEPFDMVFEDLGFDDITTNEEMMRQFMDFSSSTMF